MALEIERKFLVSAPYKHYVTQSQRIVQGYLSTVPERTVRVRIKGDQGYITIKGKNTPSYATRHEWEYIIPLNEAEELLHLCENVIEKVRYLVPVGNHVFEVDEFGGENQGLVVAELELADEDEVFDRPVWLGAEVTCDVRYYNSNLIKRPYSKW